VFEKRLCVGRHLHYFTVPLIRREKTKTKTTAMQSNMRLLLTSSSSTMKACGWAYSSALQASSYSSLSMLSAGFGRATSSGSLASMMLKKRSMSSSAATAAESFNVLKAEVDRASPDYQENTKAMDQLVAQLRERTEKITKGSFRGFYSFIR